MTAAELQRPDIDAEADDQEDWKSKDNNGRVYLDISTIKAVKNMPKPPKPNGGSLWMNELARSFWIS